MCLKLQSPCALEPACHQEDPVLCCRSVMPTSLQPHSLPRFSVQGILQARVLEWVAIPSSKRSFEPRSSTLREDPLSSEPPGKPKDTGVGSLSLLQRFFIAQELNWDLPYCKQILYQLSYQGKPVVKNPPSNARDLEMWV